MNINELITTYCPNGVKYVTLGEIATEIYRGSGIKKDQITDAGISCVRYGEIYTSYGIWFDKCVSHTDESIVESKKYFEYGDLLFAITGENIEDIAKCTAYVGNERCLAGGDILILKHKQNPKYLSYALSTTSSNNQKKKGKVKSKVVHASIESIKNICIPLPPLEVQDHIVLMLDSFTAITAELTAELILRKKQYEFYRDKLLSFDRLTPDERAGVILMPISEFCSISRGKGLKKKDFTSEGIGCIHYGQIYTTYNTFTTETISFVSKECAASSKTVHPGDLIVAITSENEEDVCKAISWEGTTDIVTGGHTAILSHKQNPRFISYLFQTANFFKQKKKLVHGTKVIEISPSDLGKIIVPIPPIETQDRIVHILDKMESLCFNLSNGIPAEIEARKIQYKYYRDKLLSFDKVSS